MAEGKQERHLHVVIGRVTRPQGIRGEVRVHPLTDFPERFKDDNSVFLKRHLNGEWRRIQSHRWQGNIVIVKFEGVDDRNTAEALRDVLIETPDHNKITLPKGTYYVNDLIGLSVKTEDGDRVGMLEDIEQNGTQDLYVVRNGEKEILIPAVKSFIQKIDIEAGEIIITPIEGLIE